MDIDLLLQGKADRDSLVALVKDCALVEYETDGVIFDPSSIVAEEITRDAVYQLLETLLRKQVEHSVH